MLLIHSNAKQLIQLYTFVALLSLWNLKCHHRHLLTFTIQMNPALRKSDFLEVFLGFLLTWGMHALAIVAGIFIILGTNAISTLGGVVQMFSAPVTYFSILALLLLGLTQFVYIVPVSAWLHEHQQASLRRGVLMGALCTVLLNGGYLIWLGLLLR
jgi:hypothetical protein